MGQIQVADKLGRKVWVPEHYMTHPVLSQGFTHLPSTKRREGHQDAGEQLPDESWSHDQIDKFAADHGIDLTGATTKAEKISAMTKVKE